MTGHRAGARQVVPLPSGTYICRRCGIHGIYNVARKKPERCADCRSVECIRGHLFPPEPKRDVRGRVVCPTCKRQTQAARRAQQQAAA